MTHSIPTAVFPDDLLPASPSILLVEDDPGDTALIRYQLLERGGNLFRIFPADSLAAAAHLLAGGLSPDVILLDLNLPDSTGSQTVARCRKLCDAPIVVLTGMEEIAAVQQAIDCGAEDYLTKGGDASSLRRAIRYAILRHRRDADARLAATVFSHSHEGIIITTADGIILNANDAFCRMTGYERTEVIGKTPLLLATGFRNRLLFARIRKALLDSGNWAGEFSNRRPDREPYCASLTVSSVKNSGGHISHFVALMSDITLRKQQEDCLKHLAYHDQLTGLPNRMLLKDRLRQALARAVRNHNPLAVAYLDLDGFKYVNDKYGHDVGDRLLTTLAVRLKNAVREGDTVARLGGDEFAVVLIDIENNGIDLQQVINRLLRAVSDITSIDGLVVQVSASIGVSIYPQPDKPDVDQLLCQADQAMYQAKLAGKNRYCLYAGPNAEPSATETENRSSNVD